MKHEEIQFKETCPYCNKEFIFPVDYPDLDIFGWFMWDADEKDGYSKGFFVRGSENPVKSREEQQAYGGDHLGHFWESHLVFANSRRKVNI